MVSATAGRPALFLDRDGVINRDDGYVHAKEDFVFCDGIFDVADVATRAGMPIVVVTNQSGIGRGYYTEHDFQRLTSWMCDQFRLRGSEISGVYHCPYHRDASLSAYRIDNHPDRKPNPGMLITARNALDLDLARSIMIGDRISDLEAAQNAGLAHAIYINEPGGNATSQAFEGMHIDMTCCNNLSAAKDILTKLMFSTHSPGHSSSRKPMP